MEAAVYLVGISFIIILSLIYITLSLLNRFKDNTFMKSLVLTSAIFAFTGMFGLFLTVLNTDFEVFLIPGAIGYALLFLIEILTRNKEKEVKEA